MTDIYLYAPTRTPFGRFASGLADSRPDDLAASVIRSTLSRLPKLDSGTIDDVIWGCANQAGEDNRNVGRMAGLLAGLPVSVPAVTVNRLCGSSLEATINGARAIECDDARVVLVGGVESMTRAPWVLPKPSRAFPAANVTAVSTTLGWRLDNSRMPAEWTVSLGEANEQLGARFGIGRDRQDEFAVRSHRLGAQAWDEGFYDDLVAPVEGADLTKDESLRPSTTVESLADLRPAFRSAADGGTITPGNASPLSDGAAALVLAAAGTDLGADPVARLVSRGVQAVEPQDFGYAPVVAANRALERAGITWRDVAAVELNEAFAVQGLACVDAWLNDGLTDPDIVNAKGGAFALGHPLGASGARLIGTLAHRLRESGDRWGLAAICIGVGQALAVVLENPEAAGAR